MLAIPLYNSAFAQDGGPIEYAENGTGPVATYTAVDPEMTAIVSWTLDGTDKGIFEIEGGVLTFEKPPDFEMPGDVVGTGPSTAVANDNIYEVTVQATDGTNKVGMKEVMVEVTNVDEMGMVTLSALRPQSATAFTATLADPDDGISGTTWQWAKADSRNGSYTDIEDTDDEEYTPVDADIGSYLRATASYTDGEGSGKSMMAMSEHAVQGVPGANTPPDFPDQDPDIQGDQDTATRELAENTSAGQAIGDPVVAEDDDGDILTYTLTGTDAESFDINWATGQIMTKAALNFEDDLPYTVTVRATDPSGVPQEGTAQPANSDEIVVTINVTDVNEPPAVTGDAEVTFQEVAGDIATPLRTYEGDNPEDDVASTWSLSGTDSGKFEIAAGALTFEAQPDFERPGDANGDNVYEVTVVAADAEGNRGTMDVKVTVANEDEDGTVSLSRTQPRVGVAVRASLTDPDGSISGLTWQWYRGDTIDAANPTSTECADAEANNCVIGGAMSDTYTPTEGDVDETLTAVAEYTDGEGATKAQRGIAARETDEDTRNKPPAFVDQDTETVGVQNESTERMVEENTEALDGTDDDDAAADASGDNVGSPVMAMDPDPNTDLLVYTLSGADAGAFRVRDNGQIEVGAGTELDYETETTYMVTVMAEDSFGASATIMVTIMVTDMDEKPDVTGDASIEYAENGTRAVATYTAVDPEMTAIVSWTLGGDDAADFTIEDGVLAFKDPPDYEMAMDDGTDTMYSVTVQATDETNKVGMMEVTVEVTNVEEPGMVTLSALRPQSATAFTAKLADPDDGISGTTWQWAKASSRNGSYRDIDSATSSTYTPVDADIGSSLRATASYTDGEDSGKSAMAKSENSVQRPRGANNAPMFADDQDPVTDGDQPEAVREVAENTPAGQAIGNPVVAEDDDGDILTYTLTGTDADSFDIDWATGQIMTKAALDAESGDASYTVTVRATDPAGVPATDTVYSDTVEVTINVTDVNEPPAVTGDAEVTFQEVAGAIATPLNTYEGDNPEDDVASTWSLSGTDSGKFEIAAGALTFEEQPDFERPGDANGDNVYEVTVVAADAEGNRGTMDVKVTVANEDEDGTVSLSRTQPRVGVAVRASLTDPDGSISGLTWQWYRGDTIDAANPTSTECADAEANNCVIGGAMSDTYTPTADDATNNVTLMARAMYTDGQGAMKFAVREAANMVAVDTRNKPPAFVDQDMETDGVQNESTVRTVVENSEALDDSTDEPGDNVGSVVMATDPDPNADPLIYTLSGADAGAFTVRDNGQIEVGAGTELDYETKQTYMVTLTAEDSFGASATIMVTIMVTDMDEAPDIMEGGLTISGPGSVNYEEKSTDPVGIYTVSGPDAATAVWTLTGADAGTFSRSSDGMLTFNTSPDYENPADDDNVYEVTLEADDGTYMDTHEVTVTVTNVDEMGRVTFWRGTDDVTNDPIMVGDMLTGLVEDMDGNAGDTPPITDMYPDISDATWQWSKSMDMNNWMDIMGEMDAMYTVMDDDAGYYLRATATYTDGEGADKTAMAVSANMVSMASTNTAPAFPAETADRMVAENTAADMPVGTPVTAMDPDVGDTLTYALSGTDAASFDIGSTTGQITVGAGTMLDYEATQNTYMVTVTASDGTASDSIEVTVTVTNVDEDGMVTLWAGTDALTMAPQVGDTITGAVMDPDGGVTGETWQWARTMDTANMSSWMDIAGETNAVYMVAAGDTGYYLRVMATYTDAVGTDMAMEYSMPTMMVVAEAEDTLLNRYDANDNDEIDLDEVFTAIDDYFDYDDRLTLEEVFEIVDLYFES